MIAATLTALAIALTVAVLFALWGQSPSCRNEGEGTSQVHRPVGCDQYLIIGAPTDRPRYPLKFFD